MHLKKLTSWLLAGVLLLGMCTPVLADTQSDLEAARSRKETAESELASQKNEISSLENSKSELENNLTVLNAELTSLEEELDSLNNRISDKNAELEKTRQDLQNARADVEDQYDAMKGRIKYMYENSQTSLMAIILESDSISEFLNRIEEVRQIEKYDRDSLETYKEAQAEQENKELTLLQEEAELEDLKTQQEEKQSELENKVASVSSEVENYRTLIESEQGEAASLEAEISEQESLISALQEKLAAEEEARRKAEEEEKARLAAEKAAAEAAAKEAEEAARKAAEEAARTERVSSDQNQKMETQDAAAGDEPANTSSAYQYSQSELELIWAIVAQEDDKSYTGALAVISCAMNRADRNYGGHGTDPLSQLTAAGQFCYSPSISASIYWQRRLGGNVPSYVKQAVADCLGGVRNHSYIYFRSRSAAGRVQIGGNWYFG